MTGTILVWTIGIMFAVLTAFTLWAMGRDE